MSCIRYYDVQSILGDSTHFSSAPYNPLAQQAGNMTGGGGDLVQKMLSAAIQAKTLKTVINNKDVYVISCDPDMTDPAAQCEIYTIQPAEQQP